jgi:hypothetical protein
VVFVKRVALLVAIVAVLALVVAPGVALAQDPVVSLTVIAPDGSALANVTVKLIDASGREYSNTTDTAGEVNIAVPAAGLYYVLVYGHGYYILSVLSVTGDISATIDASVMSALSVQSADVSVEFSIARSEISTLALKFSTNATIYTDSGKDVTLEFPKEVLEFPYKYTLQKIVYETTETTSNTVSLAPTANTTMTAYYSKTLYFVLPTWALIALGVTVVVAVGVVWFATKTVKHVVASIRDNAMSFVKRKRFATRKEDEW